MTTKASAAPQAPRARDDGMTDQARAHWLALTREQQAAAIRRLASLGFGDHEIAQRTGWHVIEVRRALAAHRERIDFRYAR